jgi:hypothetical protein
MTYGFLFVPIAGSEKQVGLNPAHIKDIAPSLDDTRVRFFDGTTLIAGVPFEAFRRMLEQSRRGFHITWNEANPYHL